MVFIDTGAFVARYIKNDQHHEEALRTWQMIVDKRVRCVTSNFVLDETLTLLGRKAGYDFAAERAVNLYASSLFLILRPELEDELAAVKLFRKYADQQVSFTDCISFVLMRRQKIQRAFTFDIHFERIGFMLVP